MPTFGIVSKIHHPSVNRFDGLILWYVFDYQNKNGDDTTTFITGETRSIFQLMRNDLHTKQRKNNIITILRRCKKITSCHFSWCKFSYRNIIPQIFRPTLNFRLKISPFGTSNFQTPNNLAYSKFQTPNKHISIAVSKVKELPPCGR